MNQYRHLRCWVFAMLVLLIGIPSAFAATPQVEANPDVQPSILKTTYPDRSKLSVEKGILVVKMVVTEHGDVASVEVIKSSDQGLNAPVEAALMKWRFKPALKDGKACAARVKIPVRINI